MFISSAICEKTIAETSVDQRSGTFVSAKGAITSMSMEAQRQKTSVCVAVDGGRKPTGTKIQEKGVLASLVDGGSNVMMGESADKRCLTAKKKKGSPLIGQDF